MPEHSSPLSQVDAFFVAYQRQTGVLMQVGAEVELAGTLECKQLEAALRHVAGVWPQLAQALRVDRWGRLAWSGASQTESMLHVTNSLGELEHLRHRSMDPFREPPFQIGWHAGRDGAHHAIHLRAHHALLDGEIFFSVCSRFLATLASLRAQAALDDPQPEEFSRVTDRVSLARSLWSGRLLRQYRSFRELAQPGRHAELELRGKQPGPIGLATLSIDADGVAGLNQRAAAAGVSRLWWTAAAWARTLREWNRRRGAGDRRPVSLEFPVSLRRGGRRETALGNFVSPLTLVADDAPLHATAQALQRQFTSAVRMKLHHAMPLFTAPGRWIPWRWLEPLCANPNVSGTATGHFTWLTDRQRLHAAVSDNSAGALELTVNGIYTPVCLNMGMGVTVLDWPDRQQFCVTYRTTALNGDDVAALLEILAGELDVAAERAETPPRASARSKEGVA